ncbi:MAG: phosphonate metabolism transcriptional regulator PhnF [Fibrobacterota bacterium]
MSLYGINRNNGQALYVQIAEVIQREHLEHTQPGTRLPSEMELAGQFGVNRHTVRRAVDSLISMGMVERRHGVGLFAAATLIDYRIRPSSRFTQNLGEKGHFTESTVLNSGWITAPAGVAAQLSVAVSAQVFWIETLRKADGIPLTIVSHFFPEGTSAEAAQSYTGGSLHEHLVPCVGRLTRKKSIITAVIPRGDDARLLGIPAGQPVLRVKSVNVATPHAHAVEYAVSRMRSDRLQLRIDL